MRLNIAKYLTYKSTYWVFESWGNRSAIIYCHIKALFYSFNKITLKNFKRSVLICSCSYSIMLRLESKNQSQPLFHSPYYIKALSMSFSRRLRNYFYIQHILLYSPQNFCTKKCHCCGEGEEYYVYLTYISAATHFNRQSIPLGHHFRHDDHIFVMKMIFKSKLIIAGS